MVGTTHYADTPPDSHRTMGAEPSSRHHLSSSHVAEQHHRGHLGPNQLSGRRYEWTVGCNCQPDLRELVVQRGGDERYGLRRFSGTADAGPNSGEWPFRI